jgi:hypothetical protein
MERDQSIVVEARRILRVLRRCAYCNRTGGMTLDPDGAVWHMDHVIPLYLNGTDTLDNITKACKACNIRKGIQLWDTRKVITAEAFLGRRTAPSVMARNAENNRRQRAVKRSSDLDRREALREMYAVGRQAEPYPTPATPL